MKASRRTSTRCFSIGPASAEEITNLAPTEALARRLEELAEAGGLRTNLRTAGVKETDLNALASEAAEQWTGTFNPQTFNKEGAIEVYQCVY